jgi:hypothetical protein
MREVNFSFLIFIFLVAVIVGIRFSKWYTHSFKVKYQESLLFFSQINPRVLHERFPYGINFLQKSKGTVHDL